MSANAQRMLVLTVKPDGNRLSIGWLDRRNDTNNSLIDVYGRWATITNNGNVSFPTSEFRITTQSFPPVFAGSLTVNTNMGYYDPVWAPGDVNLHWWYSWYPYTNDFGDIILTDSTYAHEAGEHNGASADMNRVYFVWSDNRTQWTYHGSNTNVQGVARYQPDIRLARLPWPQP